MHARKTEHSPLLVKGCDAEPYNRSAILPLPWRESARAAGAFVISVTLITGLLLLLVVWATFHSQDEVVCVSSSRRGGKHSPCQPTKESDTVALRRAAGLEKSSATREVQQQPHARLEAGAPWVEREDTTKQGKTTSANPLNDKESVGKPNVFFIMIDDIGWNDIGYQSTDLEGVTPNLDKLAAGGVKLTNYYSMAICTPARASLMTGRYAVRYGLQYKVIDAGEPWALPVAEKIFPEYMKDAGYETHMVGKWHLGSYSHDTIPSRRGFDTFLGYLNGEEMYWTHQDAACRLNGRKFLDFGFGNSSGYYNIIDRPLFDDDDIGPLSDDGGDDDGEVLSPTSTISSSWRVHANWTKAVGQYSTQIFQDRAVAILEEKTPFDEEPLYMYLSHQAVHPPLGLPPPGCFSAEEVAILEKVKANSNEDGHLRHRFAQVLMYLDRTIGDLVDYLEREGWMENSVIIIASDNGGCYADGGCNYPLRGNKSDYWEGGHKVPAFIYSRSHIPMERWGTKYDGMMHVTDWLPTIASGTGIHLDGGAGPLDGIDQWDYILHVKGTGESGSPRKEMLYNFDPYTLLEDDSHRVQGGGHPLVQGAFRSGKYKFLWNAYCAGWYSFHESELLEDPLMNNRTVCDGSSCSCCAGDVCTNNFDYLFDLEADPREERNLIAVHPEIAEALRSRMTEVALEEWTDSAYVGVDTRSYYVWATYNWWMVPWWNLLGKAMEDSGGLGADR